jgi:hypothetical protein
MDPLLQKIEALAEPGCYSLTFTLPSGEDRSLVMRMRGDEPIVPAAGALEGWSPQSATFSATIAAVRALHSARQLTGPAKARLLDIEGGWDVGIGNVVLSATGLPSCVAHGELAAVEPGVFRCAECGAAARYESESVS